MTTTKTEKKQTPQLPAQAGQAGIELMPRFDTAGNIFHSLTRIHVPIEPADYYKQGWAAGETQFALHAHAIKRIANRAGIKAVEGRRLDDRSDPHLCEFYWKGEWLQPDGSILVMDATYLLDLRDYVWLPDGIRKRGGRFDEMTHTEVNNLLEKEHEARGIKPPLPFKTKEKTLALMKLWVEELNDVERHRIELLAEAIALQQIVNMRPHIVRRAETGAMAAAMRTHLGLKSQYTLPELERGFVVYRTKMDVGMMKELLGDAAFAELAQAAAAQYLGVSLEKVRLLGAGTGASTPPTQPPGETPAGTDNEQAITGVSNKVIDMTGEKVPPEQEIVDAKRALVRWATDELGFTRENLKELVTSAVEVGDLPSYTLANDNEYREHLALHARRQGWIEHLPEGIGDSDAKTQT